MHFTSTSASKQWHPQAVTNPACHTWLSWRFFLWRTMHLLTKCTVYIIWSKVHMSTAVLRSGRGKGRACNPKWSSQCNWNTLYRIPQYRYSSWLKVYKLPKLQLVAAKSWAKDLVGVHQQCQARPCSALVVTWVPWPFLYSYQQYLQQVLSISVDQNLHMFDGTSAFLCCDKDTCDHPLFWPSLACS